MAEARTRSTAGESVCGSLLVLSATSTSKQRSGRVVSWVLGTALLTLTLAGCADDETGRRFANDARPEPGLPTSVPRLPATQRPVVVASPISDSQLLQTRGAAGRFYYEVNDTLWTMAPAAADTMPVFAPPAGTVIRALAPSPNGDRVAALLVDEADGGERASVIVLADSGAELFRIDDIATLAEQEAASAVSLDWSPQGEKLLVGLNPGGLMMVPITGEQAPRMIVVGELGSSAASPAWSPTGEEIGFLAPTDANQVGLYVAAPAASPVPLLTATTGDRLILDWAWLPDGRSLLFSEQDGDGGSADLWRIQSDGSDRELVASAGRVAPVARIVNPTPSRDGRSVAYVIVVPDGTSEAFHSLWVRSLGSNQGFAVNIPPDEAVTDLWWTDAGLMVRTVQGAAYHETYQGGGFTIYQVVEGSQVRVAVAASDATPQASPVATPLATPVAGTLAP